MPSSISVKKSALPSHSSRCWPRSAKPICSAPTKSHVSKPSSTRWESIKADECGKGGSSPHQESLCGSPEKTDALVVPQRANADLSVPSVHDHNSNRTMKTKKPADPIRPYSSIVFDGPERAAARAMLYPVGFKPEDFQKPLIGVASTWGMVTPCNMHIDKLAREAEAGANDAGGKAIIFNTITVSDGISMGSEGMKYSLVSREVIADSIETVVGCAGMDGFVAIGGCDKNMPGALIAIARLNRPAVFVYGGTILPGCLTISEASLDGPRPSMPKTLLDIVSVFEAVGKHAAGKIDDRTLQAIEQCAIPGPGSCGGMYTANTMASAIEALGRSLPNSSAQNAMSKAKVEDCRRAGAAVVEMLKQGLH